VGGGLQATPDMLAQAAKIIEAGWPIGPRPFPCGCGAPLHAHAAAGFGGQQDPPGCDGLVYDPADQLALAAVDADGRLAMADVADHNTTGRTERRGGRWQVSPSDVGGCRRQVWYRECPPGGYEPLPEDTRKADAGTAMHAGITEARAALYPWREHKVRLTVPGLDRDGEADEYDPLTATLEDWKTAGPATWDYVGVHGPREKAWKQAFIYAYALVADGRQVRRVRIRYVHRETGREEVFTRTFDLAYALAALGELIALATMLDVGVVPPRDGRGPTVDPLCGLCPARTHCWNMTAAEAAGRTPETYTRFGANPDASDPDVLWAVAQAGYTRLERLAAEKDEKACKALADVDAGTYGDWEVKRGSTSRSNFRAAFEELVDALGDWEATDQDERPKLASIVPPVRKSRSRTLEIVPVRKATTETGVPVTGAGVR
jgi:hypothetical protein